MEDRARVLNSGTEVIHPQYGSGWVASQEGDLCTVEFSVAGRRTVRVTTLERPGEKPAHDVELDRIKRALREILSEQVSGTLKIGDRWRGGTALLKPKNPELKGQEIPLEKFFHKVVLVRESLRVLEQKINNHPKLDDADRLELQEYLTRVYGSLTTFNALFANKEDHFVGQKGERESGDI